MAKKVAEKVVGKTKPKYKEPYWVYPGERRPVVVQAYTEKIARERVLESPEYDGFPVAVYPIDKFNELCMSPGGYKAKDDSKRPTSDALESNADFFFIVKVVDGKIQKMRLLSEQDKAEGILEKTSKHLDLSKDDIRIFVLRGDAPVSAEGPFEIELEEHKLSKKEPDSKD